MSSTVQHQEKICKHCFGKCASDSHERAEGFFCCDGCFTAFKIINDGNYLENYKPNKPAEQADFEQLVTYKSADNSTIEFEIPSIHCIGCVQRLENLHALEPSVENVRVDFIKKKVKFIYNHHQFSVGKLIDLLNKIGYEPNLNYGLLSNQSDKREVDFQKDLLIKIGVSGFVAGNIMLFSLPEYFGLSGDFYAEFKKTFAFLNLFLSIPVVFYCAGDYFKSAYYAIKSREINFDVPICLGFSSLLALSYYEIVSGKGAGYLDSFSALIFFLLISRYFQNLTFAYIDFERDYMSYFPVFVTKISGFVEKQCLVKDLELNDIILIKHNEIIPVDAVLIKGEGEVDYSFITGESAPVYLKQHSEVLAGVKWLSAPAYFRVKKLFSQHKFIDFWKNNHSKKDLNHHTHIDLKGKIFLYAMIVIATSISGYWVLESSFSYGVYIFTCLMVAACPCVLAISTPVVNGMITRWFSKFGLFLKDARSIYELSQIDTIVFDKTGTLSKSQSGTVEYQGVELDANQKIWLKSALKSSTHPYSQIIYKNILAEELQITSFKEMLGQGIQVEVNNNLVRVGKISFVKRLDYIVSHLQHEGSQVWVSINNQVLGCFTIHSEWRENIDHLKEDLASNHLAVHVLSGDNEKDAEKLNQIFEGKARLNFNQTPESKHDYIEKLQSSNHNVLMVGDGLNDALALKKSNFSISVIENGSRFFPACDGVVKAENFKLIGKFITLSKKANLVINCCFYFSVFYNVVGIYLAANGYLTPLKAAILMPLNSLTVLFVSLFFSNFFAKSVFK